MLLLLAALLVYGFSHLIFEELRLFHGIIWWCFSEPVLFFNDLQRDSKEICWRFSVDDENERRDLQELRDSRLLCLCH